MLQAAKYIGSGLATIGLTKKLLQPVLSSNRLCPSVISHLAEKAILTVDKMLRRLPRDSLVLKHISEMASRADLHTTAVVEDGHIQPNETIQFSQGRPTSQPPSGTGVYVFTELTDVSSKSRQAVGSAVRFDTRLYEHLDSFTGRANPTSLHIHGMTVNGADSFSFGPIYFVPNYLLSFYESYPGYVLTQGDYDILMAVSQLVPRILEQSILNRFPCLLNGRDRLVRFRYTSFSVETLNTRLVLGKSSIPVNVISDGVVVYTTSSKQQLLGVLGIGSRRTVDRYMNHVLPLQSTLLGSVNLQEVYFTGPPLTHELVHRLGPERFLTDLVIPGLDSPDDLLLGPVYVYNQDKTIYGLYPSIVQAAKELNPSKSKPRGQETKISRLIGLEGLVTTELGSFYFNENPGVNRFRANHSGQYPCNLYDLELDTCTYFHGLKPLVRHLS